MEKDRKDLFEISFLIVFLLVIVFVSQAVSFTGESVVDVEELFVPCSDIGASHLVEDSLIPRLGCTDYCDNVLSGESLDEPLRIRTTCTTDAQIQNFLRKCHQMYQHICSA